MKTSEIQIGGEYVKRPGTYDRVENLRPFIVREIRGSGSDTNIVVDYIQNDGTYSTANLERVELLATPNPFEYGTDEWKNHQETRRSYHRTLNYRGLRPQQVGSTKAEWEEDVAERAIIRLVRRSL